jgi:hypothetical protein
MGNFTRFLVALALAALAACGGDRFGTELFYDAGAPDVRAAAPTVLEDAGDADPNSSYLDGSYRERGDVLEQGRDASDGSPFLGPDAGERPDAPPPPPPDAGEPQPAVCCWDPGPDAGASASHPCAIVTIGSGTQSVCKDGVSCVWIFAATGSAYQGVGAPCP